MQVLRIKQTYLPDSKNSLGNRTELSDSVFDSDREDIYALQAKCASTFLVDDRTCGNDERHSSLSTGSHRPKESGTHNNGYSKDFYFLYVYIDELLV